MLDSRDPREGISNPRRETWRQELSLKIAFCSRCPHAWHACPTPAQGASIYLPNLTWHYYPLPDKYPLTFILHGTLVSFLPFSVSLHGTLIHSLCLSLSLSLCLCLSISHTRCRSRSVASVCLHVNLLHKASVGFLRTRLVSYLFLYPYF